MAFLSGRWVAKVVETSSGNPRAVRRVLINHELVKASKLVAGDLLLLAATPSFDGPFALGTVWPSTETDPECAEISLTTSLTANISDGDTLCIFPVLTTRPKTLGTPCLLDLQEASSVRLIEISPSPPPLPKGDSAKWLTLYLRELLVDIQFVTRYQTIRVRFQGQARTFRLQSASCVGQTSSELESELETLTLDAKQSPFKQSAWTVGWDTIITLETPPKPKPRLEKSPSEPSSSRHHAYGRVGGLDKEIEQVRDLIELPLSQPELFTRFGLKPPRGILLHGPPGTGKTHLARAIADASGASLITVSGPELSSAYHGETESKLRAVFEDAKAKSPCIIVMDEVDAICPKREEGGGVEARVVTTLLTLMDGMGSEATSDSSSPRVVVVATTNRPNSIDPALRRPGRFDREIEIGIPSGPARFLILDVLLTKTPHNLSLDDIDSIAKVTHGYVGADLASLVRDAGTRALKRWIHQSSGPEASPASLTYEDIVSAMATIRPSALREHIIESPRVLWEDIGGQASVKQKLEECVEWPLRYPGAFTRLGIAPPKGVLLYGPPGCSKTLTAKALATESGINFIAVKGPELLNKYVGESERAIRDIFRKARGASPSIVFFDEIDAIATSRSGEDGNNSHQGVLTSLLNEMDGIQALNGVVVVAATNRPDVLDSAMMRPGRLDRILYVGPPDLNARKDILRIRTSKMAVDPTLDINALAELTDGCSGAEITAMCQDAALMTMKGNINAPFVLRDDFIASAKGIRRQITPAMIEKFDTWRLSSGLPIA